MPYNFSWIKFFNGCVLNVCIFSSWGFTLVQAEPLLDSSVTGNRPHIQDLGLKIGQYESGEWNAITDRIGRDSQQALYRKSLGLE